MGVTQQAISLCLKSIGIIQKQEKCVIWIKANWCGKEIFHLWTIPSKTKTEEFFTLNHNWLKSGIMTIQSIRNHRISLVIHQYQWQTKYSGEKFMVSLCTGREKKNQMKSSQGITLGNNSVFTRNEGEKNQFLDYL